MKVSLFLLLALALVIAAMAVPGQPSRVAPELGDEVDGRVLVGEACSGIPCRLIVESGRGTTVDRGTTTDLTPTQTFVGTFRYWEEATGPVLWVYDDVQNLVARVVNPQEVRVFGPVDEIQ